MSTQQNNRLNINRDGLRYGFLGAGAMADECTNVPIILNGQSTNQHINKSKNNIALLRPDKSGLRRATVEPERIELSSREDNTVPSTCLVVFRL